MTFHSIVRQWCKIYKPMLDSVENGNRRFYLTDSRAGVVEMAKSISDKFSPFVMMESNVEGGGKISGPSRNYAIYFFVKAEKMADGDEAAAAMEEAWWHCQNFLTWLKEKHDEQVAENIEGDFSRINLDDVYIDITTAGPLENGWYAVLVQFERDEPLNLCVDKDLYVEKDG